MIEQGNSSEPIWHLSRAGKRYGPFSQKQLLEFGAEAKLRGDDLLWTPGFETWKPAHSVLEFPNTLPSEPSNPQKGMPGGNYFKGYNGQVEVSDTGVTITRKGLLGLLTHGFKGEKRFPFTSISAVQFKNAGMFVNGYIQFSILGGVEARGGVLDASSDENTVMFWQGAQDEAFARLREIVEHKIADTRRPATTTLAQTSIADELGKLADLVQRGLLTDAEFAAQKRALLRRT